MIKPFGPSELSESSYNPGFVLGSTNAGGERSIQAGGMLGGNTTLVTDTTIYDCASLTKSVITTTLLHSLLARNEIALDDTVDVFLPEAVWVHQVTIADLLSYTVDFGLQLSLLKNDSPAEIKRQIFTAQQVVTNLSQPTFINATSMILGWILESVSEQPLQKIAADKIFEPLGMSSSWLDVAGDERASELYAKHQHHIAPSEVDAWRGGEVRGQVHDESAWVFARQGMAVGSAGLFSSVPDLLTFAEWVLQENQLQQNSLGWEKNAAWMPAVRLSHGSDLFGKSGFTGCGIVICPEKNKAAVLLTNAVYPRRPSDRTTLNTFRREKVATAFE